MSNVLLYRKACGAVALVSLLWTFIFFPVCAMAETLTLRSGAVVKCTVSEDISPVTTTVGQRITLRVSEAVKVNGVTVIEAGAPVQAEVTQAQKQGSIGKPAIIGISLRSVTAVDGDVIALSGQKVLEGESKQSTSLVVTILCCVLGLLMKGGPASIPAGTNIDATVVSEVQIEV